MANYWTKPDVAVNSINCWVSQPDLGNPAPSLLILGYGNPLRGDDALGPFAAEELAKKFSNHPHVTVQTAHQLTLDLAETLADYDMVILIDARVAEPAGEVYTQMISSSEQLSQPFSHYFSPAELLTAAEILYQAQLKVVLTGINATSFEVGAALTSQVQQAIPDLVSQIEALTADFLERNPI